MLGICPRYVVMCYFYKVPISDKKDFPAKTYLTFRIGEKIEDIVREVLNGKKPSPMVIKIENLYIVGSPDIVVENKYLVECKSISRAWFEELNRPFVKHEAQLNFYLWMASKCPSLGYSKHGAIIYVPKEEASDVAKVFPVSLSQGFERHFNNVINSIKRGIKERKLPKRICMDTKSPAARSCKLVKYCFRGGK